MYRPSRVRRVLKWTGAGLSLLILAAWVVSAFKAFGHVADGRAYVVGGGCVLCFSGGRIYASEAPDLFQMMDTQLRGSIGMSWPSVILGSVIIIPLWLPFVVSAIPTAWLWHRDRRRIPRAHCQRCGYDLTGNTSGACSECGEKITEAEPPPAIV